MFYNATNQKTPIERQNHGGVGDRCKDSIFTLAGDGDRNEKQEEDGRDEPSGLVSLIHLPYSLMVSPRVSNKETACRTTSRLTTDESALDMRTSALFMVVSLQPGGPVVCCNYSPDLWGYINELSA